MSTATEIEHAIESLPEEEYAKLLEWIDERRTAQVDADFAAAVLAGKFDFLAQQAENQIAAGVIVPREDFLRGEG